MTSFPEAARVELANVQLRTNLRNATDTIRAKRRRVVAELPDWEELREAGQAIKTDVLANLQEYLLQFEAAVQAAGGHVHWARDAAEANAVVAQVARAHGVDEVVKVKSLTTDEIKLNEALANEGIRAIETDFAELILQLDGDWSSHILVPAIHRNRAEIRDLFARTIAPGITSDDPADLAEAARFYLRERFLAARVGVSGANFAIAETGTVCVVESEGNGRMCTTLPPVLVTVLGIEKLLPRFSDLEVFLQLLPRSSTGERMNPYTSLWTGVTPGDGPQEFHVVLLDNGRTRVLARRGRPSCLALHPVQRLPERLPRLLPDRWARLRLGLPGPDRRDPRAAADRHREGGLAALRLHPLRRLLRGLPGQDRHSEGALAPAGEGGRSERQLTGAGSDALARLGVRRSSPARGRAAGRTPRPAAVRPRRLDPPASRAARELDAHARPQIDATRKLPLLVAKRASMSEAREEILSRIAAAVGAPAVEPKSERTYRRRGALGGDECVELFCRAGERVPRRGAAHRRSSARDGGHVGLRRTQRGEARRSRRESLRAWRDARRRTCR